MPCPLPGGAPRGAPGEGATYRATTLLMTIRLEWRVYHQRPRNRQSQTRHEWKRVFRL